MKKTWIVFLLLAALISCDKSIDISSPTILIENELLSISEQVTLRVVEYVIIDGIHLNADYFEWLVEDSEGNIVKNDFKDSSMVYWIPDSAGYFVIKVKIGYDNNKSIQAIKDVNVYETVASLKKKMIGHWKGVGTRHYDNSEWGIDLYIDSTGHYWGTADFYSFDPYCNTGVFHSGRLDYYTDNLLDSCGVPDEASCATLELNEANNNKGFGVVWIAWIRYSNGILQPEHCTDLFDIEDLEISQDGQRLYFEFNDRGSDDHYEWKRKFDLVKQ